MRKPNISALCLTVSINGQMHLFIMLDEHGSINRVGPLNDGDQHNGDMFIGHTDPQVFQTLRDLIPDDFFDLLGKRMEHPNRQGTELIYEVVLRIDEADEGFALVSDMTNGVPEVFHRFINAACEATNSWHEAQKRMVAAANPTKETN